MLTIHDHSAGIELLKRQKTCDPAASMKLAISGGVTLL